MLGWAEYTCEREQHPVLTGFGKILLWLVISKVESRERLQSCHILMVLWQFVKEYVCCVYVLIYAINILCLIEQFYHFECYVYLLVCLQIYAVKVWMWEKDQTMDYQKLRSINWSISCSLKSLIIQPINHQFIDDWGWEREERIGGEVQKRGY